MIQKIYRSSILLPLIQDSYRNEYTEYTRHNLRFSDAGAGIKAGELCERQIYYDMKNNKEKSLLTSGSLVFFEDGRIHEQDIRRRLRLVLRSPEREVRDDFTGAKGKIDNTVYISSIASFLGDFIKTDIPEDDVETKKIIEHAIFEKNDPVLEIKSVNQYQFQMMADSGQLLQKYYDQVQYYLWVSQKKFAIILIKNRNSFGEDKGEMPYIEFIIFPDPARQKIA